MTINGFKYISLQQTIDRIEKKTGKRLSDRTLRFACERGSMIALQPFGEGTAWFVLPEEVDRYISGHMGKPGRRKAQKFSES